MQTGSYTYTVFCLSAMTPSWCAMHSGVPVYPRMNKNCTVMEMSQFLKKVGKAVVYKPRVGASTAILVLKNIYIHIIKKKINRALRTMIVLCSCCANTQKRGHFFQQF